MRSVLITGGAGSFGRAFAARMLEEPDVERVCIFSRGELRQAELRDSLGNDPKLRLFLGDVRDVWRLERAFEDIDVVVHAAALKRIEVGHYNPDEMVKTNVLGAMNVIDAARRARVKRVVALSTDKACEPVSAYGQSKALMESLFLAANHTQSKGPEFFVTRYGNVAGSAGSVIPKWRSAIADTGRITVTDPDCTRFWMTMDDAVALVRSAALGEFRVQHGGAITPTLPAYRLGDLALAMEPRDILEVGLPPWEKRAESMAVGQTSDDARRMTIDELREALKSV